MKVGNELLCKKDLYHWFNDSLIMFKKSQTYKILDINDYMATMTCEENNETNEYVVSRITSLSDIKEYQALVPNTDNYIWFFFYKPSELRSKKIKTII